MMLLDDLRSEIKELLKNGVPPPYFVNPNTVHQIRVTDGSGRLIPKIPTDIKEAILVIAQAKN